MPSTDKPLQGTSLDDFDISDEDPEDQEYTVQRVSELIVVCPHADLSIMDTLRVLPEDSRSLSDKSAEVIRDELRTHGIVPAGEIRFLTASTPGDILEDLASAGTDYIPTDSLTVRIPTLGVFGESLRPMMDSITEIYSHSFVDFVSVLEAEGKYIDTDIYEFMRHLNEDVCVELTARDRQEDLVSQVPSGEWTGRPPVGFKVEDGHLTPVDGYHEVRDTLRLVDCGELSKRSASDKIDASPRTITRILDDEERRKRYSLDALEHPPGND